MVGLDSRGPAVEVRLAVVPHEEFEVHSTEGVCPLRFSKDRFSEPVARHLKASARHGWKGKALWYHRGTAEARRLSSP